MRRSGLPPRAGPSRTTAAPSAGRRGSRRRAEWRCCTEGSRRASWERAVALQAPAQARRHAETRPDLEHDVLLVELGEPARDAHDVLVDEEMLAELAPLAKGKADHGRPNAAAAFASITRARTSGCSPRTSARTARVWTT